MTTVADHPDRVIEDSRARRRLAFSWPLAVASAIYTVVLTLLTAAVWKSCGGHLGYPMDDTYIHMAMARSLAAHGVWGLTRYGFSSTSSSPLFTLILAGVYVLTGPNELAPLALDVVCGFVLLWFFDFALRRANVPALPRAALLVMVVFGMPLGPETMAGMEHTLHTLLTLVFVYFVVRALCSGKIGRGAAVGLMALSALLVLARYESIALAGAAGVLFLVRRRWSFAVGLVAAAVAPIAAFGLYSMAKGWYPVPTSIVAKISRPGKGVWPYALHWAEQLRDLPFLVYLAIGAVVLWIWAGRRGQQPWTAPRITSVLFLPVLLLHLQFARIGWFYRYEAYLIVFGIYACAIAMPWTSRRPIVWGQIAAVAVLAAMLAPRAIGSLWLTSYASRNIHEQQYQMGRFLRKYFGGETVLLSDIGASAYLSDARIVDLYGLSTIEVARAKVRHAYDQEFRRELARKTGAKIAILYPTQYTETGGLPPDWIPVGTWTISENQICWADTVTFLAVNPAEKERLIADLRAFERELPHDVKQSGEYVRQAQ